MYMNIYIHKDRKMGEYPTENHQMLKVSKTMPVHR